MDWRSRTPATASPRSQEPNAGPRSGPGPGFARRVNNEPLPPGMQTLPVGLLSSLGRPLQPHWTRPIHTKAPSTAQRRAVDAEPLPPGLSLPPLGSVIGLSDPPHGALLRPSAKLPPPPMRVLSVASLPTGKADSGIRAPPLRVSSTATPSAQTPFHSQRPCTNPFNTPLALHESPPLLTEDTSKGTRREMALTRKNSAHTSSPAPLQFRDPQQRPPFAVSQRQRSSLDQALLPARPSSSFPPFLLTPGSHTSVCPESAPPSQPLSNQAPVYTIANSEVQKLYARQSRAGMMQTSTPHQEPSAPLSPPIITALQELDSASRSTPEAVGSIPDRENNSLQQGEREHNVSSLKSPPPLTAIGTSKKQIPRKEFKIIKKRLQKRERRKQRATALNKQQGVF